MSWQAYVDSSLVGSGHIDKACIVSVAGDSVWATTTGFDLKPAELKTIATIIEESSKGSGPASDKAFAEGLFIAGARYVVARIDEGSLYARQGKIGVCIAKSKQAILIGHHPEHAQAGNATQTVQALADYLVGVGY